MRYLLNFFLLATCFLHAQPPNVLLILADDQGAHLSALGTPGISTPNIDRLAENGMLFTNAFAAVPSCSPSRSSINTGMFPHANGHWRNTITPKLSDPDSQFGRQGTRVDKVGIHEYITTLPEALAAAGYFTGITQKFHMSPPWKFPYTARDPVHNDPGEYAIVTNEFLQEAGDRPFFIQANISPPHRPFRNHLKHHPGFKPDADAIAVPDDLPDTPEMRADLQEYFACVQLADACVGTIIETLRRSGKLENTLIIYTSDQGQAYHRAKASAYYAGLHVPLIVSGMLPGEASRNDDLISLTDLMPTILDFLELPIPETVQGQSFLPQLQGQPATDERDYVFGEHNSHGPARAEHYPTRMAFDGRYYYLSNLMPDKDHYLPADLRDTVGWGNYAYGATIAAQYTHPLPYRLLRQLESGRPAVELYDVIEDPACTRNLAEQPEYRTKRDALAVALTAWRVRTGDREDDPLDIPTRQLKR